MRRVGLTAPVLAAFWFGMACITVEREVLPTPGPDRVVGIDWHCTVRRNSDGELFELQGAGQCEVAFASRGESTSYLTKYVRVLTVRTGSGAIYEIADDGNSSIEIGDIWPPP